MRLLILWFIVVMALWHSAQTAPRVYAADGKPISVVGDDERDAYVGTGGLVLPTSFTGSQEQRKSVSECLGCRWTYRVQCASDLHDMCMQAALSCPATTIRYEVWFQKLTSSPAQIGTVCWGNAKPPTRVSISRELAQRRLEYVPDLKSGVLPSRETVQGLTNYFWTGQPHSYQSPAMTLSGLSVRVSAEPLWRWVWGDGTIQWTRSPGAVSRASSVAHKFTKPGRYRISVTTIWQATFSVEGLGTFPVVGPDIRQTDAIWLQVHGRHVALSGV